MKYLSNLPLKQKLSCIILSVLTLILLFFLLALQISKYSYNEQLYRAIAVFKYITLFSNAISKITFLGL